MIKLRADEMAAALLELTKDDMRVLKYLKNGGELSGFEGVHGHLANLGYLDGDLVPTEKLHKFTHSYELWDSVEAYENNMFASVKPDLTTGQMTGNEMKEALSELTKDDLRVLKFLKNGGKLSGLEGVHTHLYDCGYLQTDLLPTDKAKKFMESYVLWDSVEAVGHKGPAEADPSKIPDIPEDLQQICRDLAKVAQAAGLYELTGEFKHHKRWGGPVSFSWHAGRHEADVNRISISTTLHVNTTVDLGKGVNRPIP
jgi:hypothetical protein